MGCSYDNYNSDWDGEIMSKYIINVRETVVYNHRIIIESDKSLRVVDSILDVIEKEVSNVDGVKTILPQMGCKIIEVLEASEDDTDIEIDELEDVEEV